MAPMSGPLIAALAGRTIIAPGIADLRFAMRSPPVLDFRAGQFVSLAVGDGLTDTGETLARRSYSIASPSDQGETLRLILRIINDGPASRFLMNLPVGAEIPMTGPHGFFTLDAQHAGDIVFAVTGTGIAAVLPMLGELAAQPRSGQRRLYWGLRHADDIFARDEVVELCRLAGVDQDVYLTAPPEGWAGGRGRITGPIMNSFPTLVAPTFYLVGNGAMIEDLKRQLVSRGVNRKKQIRTEAFFD
jgi:ferredoxin-NADP reductase